MIDILELYGYYFQSHYSIGIDGHNQSETIERIWMKNKVIFTQSEIESIGMKIHSYLMKQIDVNKYCFNKGEIVKYKW